MRPARSILAAARPPLALVLVLPLAACGGGGGDGGSGPPGPPSLSVAAASPSGDGQTGPVGERLPDPLRVIVRRDGSPSAGVAVAWTISSGGGSIAPAQASTDADGIATAQWTLGPTSGTQGARAAVTGASGSPVAFAATATSAAGNLVRVENNIFAPATITVDAGATVVWEWATGAVSHNITPVAPATIPSSPSTRDAPASYQVTFPAVGTYQYFCSVHGTPTSGMRGTVVVR